MSSPNLSRIKTENWNIHNLNICKVIQNPVKPDHFYLASRVRGLLDYDRKSGKLVPLDPVNPSPNQLEQIIWNAHLDADGNLWYDKETQVIRMDKNGKRSSYRLYYQNEPLRVLFFTYDRPGKIMWLIAEKFVARLDTATGKYEIIEIPPFPGRNESPRANHLLLDGQKLWVGTDHGLLCLSTRDNRVLSYFTEKGSRESNHVYWLLKARNGDIWVAHYKGGIKVLNAKTGRYSSAGCPAEVAKLPAVWIKQNQAGMMWAMTNTGLYVFHPAQGRLRQLATVPSFNFDDQPSKPDQETKSEQYFLDSKGTLLSFDLDAEMIVAEEVPKPVITEFKAMEQQQNFTLERAEARLRHNQNYVNFTFSIPEFSQPDAFVVDYRLDGLEHDWNPANGERRVSYANLHSGPYTFLVRAASKTDQGKAKLTRLSFEVRAPFWQHPLFYVLSLGLVVLVIYLIFSYRYQQKLRLLRMREHVARDLHDDMGSQLSSLSILSQNVQQLAQRDPELARKSMEKIGETARQVMDTMSEIVWNVNPENDSLARIVERMKDFGGELFDLTDTELIFETEEEVLKATLPMEKRRDFFLIFKEALTNAARYAQASTVLLRTEYHHGALRLTIRDDGQGFDPAQPPRSKGGNGLKNMRARAEKIGAELEISSAPHQGTTLILQLPLS